MTESERVKNERGSAGSITANRKIFQPSNSALHQSKNQKEKRGKNNGKKSETSVYHTHY